MPYRKGFFIQPTELKESFKIDAYIDNNDPIYKIAYKLIGNAFLDPNEINNEITYSVDVYGENNFGTQIVTDFDNSEFYKSDYLSKKDMIEINLKPYIIFNNKSITLNIEFKTNPIADLLLVMDFYPLSQKEDYEFSRQIIYDEKFVVDGDTTDYDATVNIKLDEDIEMIDILTGYFCRSIDNQAILSVSCNNMYLESIINVSSTFTDSVPVTYLLSSKALYLTHNIKNLKTKNVYINIRNETSNTFDKLQYFVKIIGYQK